MLLIEYLFEVNSLFQDAESLRKTNQEITENYKAKKKKNSLTFQ
jgi:hypothetical protein